MKKLERFGVTNLNTEEINEVNGGFIPLVILGVTYSAPAVAAFIGSCFFTGVGVGVAVAASE